MALPFSPWHTLAKHSVVEVPRPLRWRMDTLRARVRVGFGVSAARRESGRHIGCGGALERGDGASLDPLG